MALNNRTPNQHNKMAALDTIFFSLINSKEQQKEYLSTEITA